MGLDYVKVYGLPRSGTNYLQALFLRNFPRVEFLVNILGWKHGPAVNRYEWLLRSGKRPELLEAIKDSVHTVIITKDPFAWITSYCNYYFGESSPASRNLTFVKDLTAQYCNLHRHWYEHFIDGVNSCKARFVKYEDLLMDFQNELAQLADDFKLKPPSEWIDHTTQTKPSDDKQFRDTGNPFAKKEYYLKRSYLKDYPQRLKEKLIKAMDKNLLDLLGYSDAIR